MAALGLVLAVTAAATPMLASAAAVWLDSSVPGGEAHPPIRIAVIRQGDIWIVDAMTGDQARVTTDGRSRLLGWATDGRTLFVASDEIGQPERAFRWRPGQALAPVIDGRWSPDGTMVALTQASPGAAHETLVELVANGRRARISAPAPDFRWFPLAWSPDGRSLALGREGIPSDRLSTQPMPPLAGSLWISVDDPFAGHLHRLPLPPTYTGDPGWPDAAGWSPDGRFLAVGVGPDQPCVSCRADGVPFYAIPIGGGPPVRLGSSLAALDPDEALSWAANDSFVVLSTTLGTEVTGRETYAGKQIVRVDLPVGTRRDLSHDSRWADLEPAVSPDGRVVAFARGRAQQPWIGPTDPGPGNTPVELIASRHVWLMDADGANPRPLSADPGWTDEAPVWTPDGRWIVFVRWRAKPSATAELWAVRPDGSGLQRLASGLDLSRFHDGFGYYGSFAWRRVFAVARR